VPFLPLVAKWQQGWEAAGAGKAQGNLLPRKSPVGPPLPWAIMPLLPNEALVSFEIPRGRYVLEIFGALWPFVWLLAGFMSCLDSSPRDHLRMFFLNGKNRDFSEKCVSTAYLNSYPNIVIFRIFL
jgi:hypothetical protein